MAILLKMFTSKACRDFLSPATFTVRCSSLKTMQVCFVRMGTTAQGKAASANRPRCAAPPLHKWGLWSSHGICWAMAMQSKHNTNTRWHCNCRPSTASGPSIFCCHYPAWIQAELASLVNQVVAHRHFCWLQWISA